MEKITVIVGKRNTGKSIISRAIGFSIAESKKVFIDGSFSSINSNFVFSTCTEKTKVIIIDEVNHLENLNYLVFKTYSEVTVIKRGIEPFKINPKVIIVCSAEISKQNILDAGHSLNRRIEIIETLN